MLATENHSSSVGADSVTKPSTKTSSSSGGFFMKMMMSKRKNCDAVKQTSVVLDDYANLLSRDSNFLASPSDNSTVATQSSSLTESLQASVHSWNTTRTAGGSVATRPSVVAHASVGSFQKQEVELGKLLGKGAFSKVYEITSIALLEDENTNNNNKSNDVSDYNSSAGSNQIAAVVANLEEGASSNARATMSQNARQGKYAMKRLRKKLLRRPRDFTRAAAHLVVEAQILSKLNHPNIIKLRGSALGGASSFQTGEHDAYFLILDRVSETLRDRIHKTWATTRANPCRSKSLDESFLVQKTSYALQLASALQHLHERRLIFRDLKPDNIGFAAVHAADKSQEHSIQLYDFGTARELPVALGLSNELFHMTLNAGTKPYTATEVVTSGLYNLKADVYSWSMVVYEIFAEQVPFAHLANPKAKKPFVNRDFIQAVYVDGERPTFEGFEKEMGKLPPQEMQALLGKCWESDLFQRPTMDDVVAELQTIMAQLPGATVKDLEAIPPRPAVPQVVLQAQQPKRQSKGSGASLTDVSDITNAT